MDVNKTPADDEVAAGATDLIATSAVGIIPRKVLRLAAAIAEVDQRTVAACALGWPGHEAKREKILAALRTLGVDVAALPQVVALTSGGARRPR